MARAAQWIVWIYAEDEDYGEHLMNEIRERDGVIEVEFKGTESY